jgi:hypothetical protein
MDFIGMQDIRKIWGLLLSWHSFKGAKHVAGIKVNITPTHALNKRMKVNPWKYSVTIT